MNPRMKLLSPRRFVHLPYSPYVGKETYPSMPDYGNYLREYARRLVIVPERREVAKLKKTEEGFEVFCASARTIQCRFVVVATGIFGNPVWPEIPGLIPQKQITDPPFVLHAQSWNIARVSQGQRVLIVGSGISGVSIAEDCVRAGARVMVSRRSGHTRIVPPRLLGFDILHWFRPVEFLPRSLFGRVCDRGLHAPAYDNGYRAFNAKGQIVELPGIKQIEGRRITFVNGLCGEVDVIVVATGYRYETPFLPDEVGRTSAGHPLANDSESTDWPGLFFVGAPCARRIDSEFLRGIASDAVHVAGRIQSRLRT